MILRLPVLSILLVTAMAQTAPHVVKVAGTVSKIAQLSDGTVIGWGDATYGQLGAVPRASLTRSRYTRQLVRIPLPGKVIDIAGGEETSYALLDGGTVMAWGRAHDGELGIGTAALDLKQENLLEGTSQPVAVRGLHDVAAIAAGGRAAYAILKDGTVWGWGAISQSPAMTPVQIPGAANVVRIAASGHALALTSDGRVMSWGSNMSGELGRDPQRRQIEQAGFVEGLRDVVSIATGTQVSLAVKKDGTVWAWGSNGMGQFGNGKQPERSDAGAWTLTPQLVPGVTNAVSVAASVVGRHVLALLKNGTVMGWGNADWGQTGSGITGDFQLTPRPARITDVKAVFACGNNSLAIRRDNSLWIWGNGDRGEFPVNAVTKVPVLVNIN
ncbi:MAG TPA: hypothetical protein VGK29_06930 [Paludibaculum sp.]